eukprot:Sdes_comp20937_c0_seq1m18402
MHSPVFSAPTPEMNDSILRQKIVSILCGKDLQKITYRTVRKELEEIFRLNLKPYRNYIDELITEHIHGNGMASIPAQEIFTDPINDAAIFTKEYRLSEALRSIVGVEKVCFQLYKFLSFRFSSASNI